VTESPTPLIEMRDISKTFGAVVALRHVTFHVGTAEVVGLVGDNAAGKSTLMKILSGVHQPDTGEILLDGNPVQFTSPMEARHAGIEMVYQDFALVPELSVSQNIYLGRELRRPRLDFGMLDKKRMNERAASLIERLGLRVPAVNTPVRAISGGQQQAVAIARATAFDARLVIMDEPTASLGASAIEKVRDAINNLRSHGVSVIVISHRLEDVIKTADRAVVLKHGEVVGERHITETEMDEILYMIVAGQDPRDGAPQGATTHKGARS
jgi:simple sugar transport system ATP-binding protein